MKIETLQVGDIRLDFQPAENLIEDGVIEYVERIKHGEKLPPIRVRFDGKHYFCEDGFHRLEAARRTGLLKIRAQVLRGTLRQMEADFRKYLKRLQQHLAQK